MLDTLLYLVRGGRVPRVAAFAGSLLKIKPILSIDHGEAHVVGGARSEMGGIGRMLTMMEQKVVKGKPLHVAVMRADSPEKAGIFASEISSRFDCTELFITEFTPVMGVHTGPGVIGVAFYSGD